MRKNQNVPEPAAEASKREAEKARGPYIGPERRRHKRVELD
ncbi:hypothetical protein FHS49_003544 [Sphingobium boeckii]|uniref:Uncharacterized protein n=1 Tax=Sphingobium boeckii TaxID=1082345 RepID=A0A7W9AKT2_9SPHN|nr:hypothetical protein [Sphingobium boeckii]